MERLKTNMGEPLYCLGNRLVIDRQSDPINVIVYDDEKINIQFKSNITLVMNCFMHDIYNSSTMSIYFTINDKVGNKDYKQITIEVRIDNKVKETFVVLSKYLIIRYIDELSILDISGDCI